MLGVVIGAEAVVVPQPWDTHGVVSRSVREQGEPSQLCFIKRDVPRLLFSNLTRARPHTMTKKRKAEDPDAPPKPKWITPVDDPAWEPYMYECLYSGEEMFKASRVQLGPTKRLAWPFKTLPDRSKLSKNAEESLVRAIDIFEDRLRTMDDAPLIRDLVAPDEREVYVKDSKCPWSLQTGYLIKMRQTKEDGLQAYYKDKIRFHPVYLSYSDDAYKPLLDFHLPGAAFKVLASIVSTYPGCDVRQVKLTDEEKKDKGFTGKTAIYLTDAAISSEACDAFRAGRVEEATAGQLAAEKFFEERVKVEGPPKGVDIFRLIIPNKTVSVARPAPLPRDDDGDSEDEDGFDGFDPF